MAVTNNSGISLSLAVWLLHDEYDYVDEPNYISATKLMRPIRHIVLPPRVPDAQRNVDVEDFISRSMGTSLHDSIEKAWTKGHKRALRLLGYPDSVIDRVMVNPSQEDLARVEDPIAVYLEQRLLRQHNGYTIGGKFDMVTEGIVQDNKSTSAFAWVNGTRDDEHRLQMSIYRWLDAAQEFPVITEDFCRVNYIFTDWQKAAALSNPKYPQKRVEHKDIKLLSLKETEDWINHKLAEIKRYADKAEHEIPECTDEELWRSAPQFKYYADASKTTGRSTKNFDNLVEARQFQVSKGGKGVIVMKPGEPKRCGYCDAFPICTQKNQFNLGSAPQQFSNDVLNAVLA